MNTDCVEMRLLVQADVDGELPAASAARVEAHLERCRECAALQAQLISFAPRMRQEVTRYTAPEHLRAAMRARLAAIGPTAEEGSATANETTPNDTPVSWWRRLPRPRLGPATPFGAGFALAACLALVFVLPHTGGLPDAVVSDHIRALEPGHLMDVVSTDQHTVKPWFDGRLDFAPPVKDLKMQGFPLVGGRLDYLDNKKVAALIYQRRQHLIDLYVWPDGGHLDHGLTEGDRSGYNFLHWSQDGMAFWAVSDLASDQLAEFAALLRAQ
jgi:anti-sigma factor RsiW